MTDTPTVDDLHRIAGFWEARLGVPTCVAGGAVRDTIMGRKPKDIDVFGLSAEWNAGWEEGLNAAPDAPEWHKSEPFLEGRFIIDGVEHQVMKRDVTSVDDLLDTFDWNVALFAATPQKLWQRTDVADIRPGKALVLQLCTFPLSTLRRGYRFSERFHMQLRREDLETICTDVLALRERRIKAEAERLLVPEPPSVTGAPQ